MPSLLTLFNAARRIFVLRDRFAAAQSPAVSGAVQYGTQTTTGTRLAQLDGALRGGTQVSSVAWGNSKREYSGLARVTGRALYALIIPQDSFSDLAFGWQDAATVVDPRTNGHGFVLEDSLFEVAAPGSKRILSGGIRNVRPMEYLVIVALNDRGAYVLLSTFGTSQSFEMSGVLTIPQFPSARVLWADTTGTTATLYPYLSFLDDVGVYTNGHLIDDLRVDDVSTWTAADYLAAFSDRFERADSALVLGNSWASDAGVFGIASGKAYVVSGAGFLRAWHDGGLYDGIFEADVTIPIGTLPFFGIIIRRQDANNFIRIVNNGGNNLVIQTWVAGGFGAQITTGPWTWTAEQTYRITVLTLGNRYLMLVNGQFVSGSTWATDVNNRFLTATGVGLYAVGSTNQVQWDNFTVTPHTITLPSELRVGAVPTIYSALSTLGSDTFTDTDTTRLQAHTPTTGPAWTEPRGTWTISSNRATLAAIADINVAVQDLGTTQVECQVDVITKATYVTGTIRAGIVLSWVNTVNFLAIRLFRDTGQPNSDEVEVVEGNGSGASIQHKVNIGNALLANETYKLKVQHIVNDRYLKGLVQVFLWDGTVWTAQISYACTVLHTSTLHGLYAEDIDDDCVFDNWSASTIGVV